jgi:hypothetical protein
MQFTSQYCGFTSSIRHPRLNGNNNANWPATFVRRPDVGTIPLACSDASTRGPGTGLHRVFIQVVAQTFSMSNQVSVPPRLAWSGVDTG